MLHIVDYYLVTDVSGQPMKMWPMGCPETSVTTNQRCVTSQKSDDFSNYFERNCEFESTLMN
jgi:hypothetical protein